MEYFVNSNDEITRMFEEGKHSCTVQGSDMCLRKMRTVEI